MSGDLFIHCQNLVKIYKVAELEVVALQGLDLAVAAGEIVALIGASGSGKSTLLNILGSFDVPSAGQVRVGTLDLLTMNEKARVAYRQSVVGFVWQQPSRNLLPYLTAAENVALPMQQGNKKERTQELLAMLGLAEQANLRPEQLSGGQQQRVALAVALANEPQLLLADEPTGQLDSANAATLLAALRTVKEGLGTTILLVTHDPAVAAEADRVVSIRDGRTSTEMRRVESAGEEWVIVDRTGRLQIPAVYVDALALRGRVKIRRESDHVSIWPDEAGDNEPAIAPSAKQWRPTASYALPNALATDPPDDMAVRTENLSRVFGDGATAVRAVDGVTLAVPHGVLGLLKGRSGSGKTTLLNLLGGLDRPTAGWAWVYGQSLAKLTDKARVALRRKRVSYVFQTFGLLPFLTAQENVAVALRLLGVDGATRQRQAADLLELVGLATRAQHRVHELSGGEQQRVAIARALAGRPWLILADEPTGQLDTATGSDIIALLRDVVAELNMTVLVASHDPKVEEAADVVWGMVDGRLVEG